MTLIIVRSQTTVPAAAVGGRGFKCLRLPRGKSRHVPAAQPHCVSRALSYLDDRDAGLARPCDAHDIVTGSLGQALGPRHPSRLPSRASQIRCHLSVQQTPDYAARPFFKC
jgi:hypothetical protein